MLIHLNDRVKFMTRKQYERYKSRITTDYYVYGCIKSLPDRFFYKEHTINNILDPISFQVRGNEITGNFLFPLHIVTHINGKPNQTFQIKELYKEQYNK